MIVAQTKRGMARVPEGIGGFLAAEYLRTHRKTARRPLGGFFTDWWYNDFEGVLSPDQQAALAQQETQSLIKAGMDPQSAAAQAGADVNATLETFRGQGAAGVTWTGATPQGATFVDAAVTGAGNATGGVASVLPSLTSYWPYLVVAGIGIVLLTQL